MEYHINPSVTTNHIVELNLVECDGEYGSGSLDNVMDAVPILDGFHVTDNEGKLIGWAVMFDNNYFSGKETHFYVLPEYRRNGIGRALYKLMKERREAFAVRPWDRRSSSFFHAVGHYSQ